MAQFEVWQTPDSKWHFCLRGDDGKIEPVKNEFIRRIDCNNALERARLLHPGVPIVVLVKGVRK